MLSRDDIIKIMAGELKKRLGPRLEKLVLIGSMARNDATPESDYDCIAVVDDLTTELTDIIDDLAGDMLYTYNAVFSIIPITKTRYEDQHYNPLLINARKDGVVLWPIAV